MRTLRERWEVEGRGRGVVVEEKEDPITEHAYFARIKEDGNPLFDFSSEDTPLLEAVVRQGLDSYIPHFYYEDLGLDNALGATAIVVPGEILCQR